jgi:hypothetical protein
MVVGIVLLYDYRCSSLVKGGGMCWTKVLRKRGLWNGYGCGNGGKEFPSYAKQNPLDGINKQNDGMCT